MNESPQLQALRQKASDLYAENNVIIAQADAERRPLSEGERQDIEKNNQVFDSLVCKIEAGERGERLAQPQARPVIDTLPARGGRGAFASVGSFLSAIKDAAGGRIDPRLVQSAITTFGGEQLGPDGGFSVPGDMRATVLEQVIGKGTLVDHLSPVITPSSMVTFVTDETTPHGTSGITATWIGEGVAITESKPLLKQVNVPLYKLAGLCHASDELLEDSPGMNNYILGKIATQIRFKLEDSLVAGTGSAQPLGILAGPGKIVVDNATTVLDPKDIGNMVARLLPGHFETSFFLLHSTVLPHLWNLTIGTTPILVPDYTKSPYGTIMGRPVVVSEACSDYNTVGDFALVSSGGYALAVKSSGLRQDTTLALGFDVGLQSFRATLRVGGTPLLSAPVARKNGSTTLGHTIILDKRE